MQTYLSASNLYNCQIPEDNTLIRRIRTHRNAPLPSWWSWCVHRAPAVVRIPPITPVLLLLFFFFFSRFKLDGSPDVLALTVVLFILRVPPLKRRMRSRRNTRWPRPPRAWRHAPTLTGNFTSTCYNRDSAIKGVSMSYLFCECFRKINTNYSIWYLNFSPSEKGRRKTHF